MLESNEHAKNDIKQHENYIRTFINVGRHRNALSYLEGLMIDRSEWKDDLDSYRIEACWKLGSWDKLKQIVNSNSQNKIKDISLTDNQQQQHHHHHHHNHQTSKDLFNIVERSKSSNSFNAGIGKLFILVDERNEKEFNETLRVLREQQIGPLSAVSMEAGGGSYQRGYEYVVNLQALQEIESCMLEMLRLRPDTNDKEQYRNLLMKNLDTYLIEPWERRIQTMQPSFKHNEIIYNVRIALLNFLSSHLEINVSKPQAKLWLHLAKIARKAGMFENAYQYMLNAQGQIKTNDSSNLEELLIEKSKWYWQREDKDSALFYLQKGLNELFNNNDNTSTASNTNDSITNSELYSKVLLMYTKFSEENGSLDSETIKQNYVKVSKICSKTEQAHFQLAQFTDRLGTSVSENTGKKEKFWEYISEITSHYAKSLEFGCQYIYQSLPRMIALWLDFGADYFDCCRDARDAVQKQTLIRQLGAILSKLNTTIADALQRIPTYAFLTVYPQLVSRICHPEERVFETLSNIIMKVLFLYPSQAIWMLIAVKNSSVELRKNRCKIIMDKAIRQQPDLRKFINDSSELAEKLVQLGNLNVESGVTQLSLSVCFKPLKRLVESKDFSKLIIPSQFQVTLQLPSNESNTTNNNNTNSNNNSSTCSSSSMLCGQNQNFRTHNPYPLELVYISCFEDNVLVMNSLQKPKKVTIRGSDGKLYPFLSKAKDDLRIDYRIMEFFSVVNKCLKQEPEARRRNLYIRTYAVTPLNETSGIIEWIENLTTLRSILIKLYTERGVNSVTSMEWKQHEDKINRDKEYALKIYKEFLARYRPTVLYEWFMRNFQEPNSWYNARSNYVRTAAVMSVCGYVLGLGDRHCENILMASSNGDCIHVDFNCLFNKGESLGVPEIVPFRLTHNMIEAMGPLGYEGIYRKTCEVALKILRDYKEPLLTILKTFIYDPLVEWKTPANYPKTSTETGETISAKGQLHLQNITCRLKGMHAKQWTSTNSKVKALPLSVEGHVNSLIKEATDDRNLSQMYIGWSAFF
jgi:serine/threonine-protein kinase ATR